MPIFSGLGQRRGSKPRELHIRKISFSGCSLSSASDRSFSSDSSTSTIRAHSPRLATSTGTTSSFDGLSIHSTFQPPKRLHDRPFILSDRQHFESAPTFYDSEDAESSDLEASERDFDGEDEDQTQFTMELPHASPVSSHDYEAADEPQDYFFMHITSRPKPANQSRWSDSTIASTIASLDDLTPVSSMSEPTSAAIADAEEAEAAGASTPSTLASSASVPKRPTYKPVDSFEDYIRRGGWKRRGIVFNSEDMDSFEAR
ncbi:uncharacterized protein TrAFT101_009797 [Trichoderma asperellum]|uniref:AGC-kinase C-terminal domain-containing protein n=1 Tax=Trichoderma asperellum (strain ATCC 204424 / CBS 433.97 / NBRC 101777) TaxID=1042311 RepID=A0A2T3Z9V5_TRIA4|nr:hypothetical protein M441DRAFT_167083 [Trichoderma asperellum CBS 433.97]PTB41593.1 hypothetical protein M441DRAFT_167083 [Trichoderma asperellum CBS 433.97]UKZ94945.1 hypothetical protein TrAFT101_009797 [Trichoderma asperellum]